MEGQILFGKYKIQREIARGGMGMVYLALDITLDRQVAIKVLHAQYSGDQSFVQRFLREGRAMARLDHQNIIRVYAVEEDKGSHYIVMEFFPGKDLKQFIRDQGQIPIDAIINIGIKVAEALENAHAQRIVHRDIKPANIMVDDQGRVKIADFGIAAALEEASLTATGTVIGTPLFMSPEQAKFGSVDARSDLYSLGMVLYELATGQTPFQGMPAHTILGKLAYEPGELPLTFPEGFPGSVQNILLTLLKKDPDERIQSARELSLRLKACSAESSLSSIGEGETMVISDETFLPENDVGQSHTTFPIGTTQTPRTTPTSPSQLPQENVFEDTHSQAPSTVSSSLSQTSSTSGVAEPKPAVGKKISLPLVGAGVGICLVGGLVFFLSSEVAQQKGGGGDGQREGAGSEVESNDSENKNDLLKAEIVKAKNELSVLKKEYDDEYQLNVMQAKELSGETQAVLKKMASIPELPQEDHASEISAIFVDLMGIKNEVTSLSTNQKNIKGYLTKKETSLIERINTLKAESPNTFKKLNVETQVKQLSNSREVYETFHRKSAQKPRDLLAKAEAELLRKKSSLDKQKNVAERERQEVVGKAQRALLVAQQELNAAQARFQGEMRKISEKIVAAIEEGELLKTRIGDSDVAKKSQNLREKVQGLKTDFEQEFIRHQTEGQPKVDKADDALTMAETVRSKTLGQVKSAKIEKARIQLVTGKQDFLVAREQKEIEVKSLLGQVTSLIRDVDLMIAKKENDQGAQRQMIAEAVYQDLSFAKQDLEGEKKRYQLIFKGLSQRIHKAQERIQGIVGISELDGIMTHVEILRQDLRMIREHLSQELERVKITGSPLLAKVDDAISKATSTKTKAQSELQRLSVGELKEQLSDAKKEFLKNQAQDIQNLEKSFQVAQISFDKSASLLAQKIEVNEQNQVLVGSLIEQLQKAQKQYQAQHENLRKNRRHISKTIQDKLAIVRNIENATTQSLKVKDIQLLRQEVQGVSKEIKDLNARHHQVKEELQGKTNTLVADVDKRIKGESDGQVKLKIALALQEMKTARQQFESGGQLQEKMQNAELAEVHNLLDKTELALVQANEEEGNERLAKEEWAGQTKNEMVALRQDIDLKRIGYQDAVKMWKEKLAALKGQVHGVAAQGGSNAASVATTTFQNDLQGFQQKIHEAQQHNAAAVRVIEKKVQNLLGKSREVKKDAPSEYSLMQLDTFSKHLSEAQNEFQKTNMWHDGEMKNLLASVDVELQKARVVRVVVPKVIPLAEESKSDSPSANASGLDNILKSFQVAYEQKDLRTLRQITRMKDTRERYLKTLFERHSNVQISTEIQDISQTGAKARILITKLVGLNGQAVKINPIIRETMITIPKEGKKWGKIQW